MIPLVKKLDIDEINTSLIAIRKLLNNAGITETNITNIVRKDYDDKIQELEEKVNKYYQPSSINWQNSNGNTTVTLTFNETLPAGLYEIYLGGSIIYHTTTNFHTCNDTPYGATMKVNTDGASYTGCTGLWKTNTSFSTLVIRGYATQGSSDSCSNNRPSAGTEMCYVKKIGE